MTNDRFAGTSTPRFSLLYFSRHSHAFSPVAMAVALVLLIAPLALVVTTATRADAAGPGISIGLNGPGEVLAGDTATFGMSATNTDSLGADGFNLAFILDVPPGIAFESSPLGAPAEYDWTEFDPGVVAEGWTRWVWEDVSDLPHTGNYGSSVTVNVAQPDGGTVIDIPSNSTEDDDVYPVGSEFTVDFSAALSGDPTFLPVFDGSTGVGGVDAEDETTLAGPESATVDIIALTVRKSEPSPESELLRGVHEHTTVYRIEVENTSAGITEDAVLVDFIPAGLEFLGCGAEDNSTVDRDEDDGTINEYDGAATLAGTPAVTSNCSAPTSVDTVVATAGDASTYGVTAGQTYTRVEWDLGDLAAGSTTVLRYAAGIPLYENTTTWDGAGGAPTVISGDQGSNLDNNNGPSTRHGDASTAVDGDTWVNVAHAQGEYAGVVRTGTDRTTADRDAETVHAMDLHILKDVDAAGEEFEVGNIATFDLTLGASEYMESSQIVVIDELANGLCPLVPAGTPTTQESSGLITADCQATGTVTGAEVTLVEAFNDGTFRITFRPTSVTFPNPDDFVLAANATHVIEYEVLNREAYELTDDEYGPTTSGDGFGNYVDFTADTDAIDPIAADFPDTWRVWDDSGISIGTDLTTISKRVMPRDEVQPNLGSGIDPCTAGSFVESTQPGFRMGDTACFELRVNFPGSVDVRNAVITDFLPNGLEYAGHAVAAESTVPAGEITEDTSGLSAGRLEWSLGAPGDGGDLYVDRGEVFVAHIWATVVEPSNGPELDKPENLMKYRQQNVNGELYFLRDQADIEVDPEMRLVKGVQEVTDNASASSSTRDADSQDAPDGTTFGSNRDGIEVAEGETVTYRLDLFTIPYPVQDAVVWDALPEGITADDVDAISDGGAAYDPADAGYPTGDIDPAFATRSVVVWDGVDVPYDDGAGESRYSLTYDVTIPSPLSVESDLDNEASIIAYSAAINTSTDPTGQTYYPTDSLNTSLTDDWNTDGTDTRDDSSVYLPETSVAKSSTSPIDDNNTTAQVVKGEVADFDYSVTIPAYTSVFDAQLTDTLPTPANWTIVAADTTVTDPGSTVHGDGAFTYDGQNFSFDASTGTLTFPDTYTNTSATDDVFTVHLEAYVESTASWAHSPGTARTDTATFSATGISPQSATANVRVIEPDPQIAKAVDDPTVEAEQTVTYTLTASNSSNRPTSYDSVVIDCVPAGLSVVGGSFNESQGTAGITTTGACAAGETEITWEIGAIEGGTQETLSYDVQIDDDAAGEVVYTNNAEITGYSLDDPSADRASYNDDADETVQVIGAAITKSATPSTAGIGEAITYTIEVDIPAQVNFYDAAVLDSLPTGMTPDPTTFDVQCEFGAGGDCLPTLDVAGDPLDTSGTTIGWWFDDIPFNADTRTITVTYEAAAADETFNNHNDTRTNTAEFRWNYTDDTSTEPTDASYDPGDGELDDTATITIVEPVPSLAKVVDDDSVSATETATFTLTASNADGRPTLYDTVVVDCVPAELIVDSGSFVASQVSAAITTTGACAGGETEITWNAGAIAGGAQATLEYDVTIATTVASGDSYTNTADLTGYSADDETADRRSYTDDANETVTVIDPAISKTVAPTSASIGEVVTYTIEVTVPANVNLYDTVVADTVPTGIVPDLGTVSVTCEDDLGGSCDVAPDVLGTQMTASGSTIGWWFDDVLTSSEERILTITYDASIDNIGGNVHGVTRTNTADLRWSHSDDESAEPADASFEPGDGELSDSATETIVEPVPSLTKSVDDDTVVAQQIVTFTLTASNAGGRPDSHDTVVVDCVPAALTVDTDPSAYSASQGTVSFDEPGTCDTDETEITWAVGSIAGGDSPTLAYDAQVSPAAAGGDSYTNTADLAGYSADDPTADRREYTDGANETITVIGGGIDKTVDAPTATIGEIRTYEIEITIPSSVNFYDAIVADAAPTGLDADAAGFTWSCEFAGGGDCSGTIPTPVNVLADGDTAGWFLGDITSDPTARFITLSYDAVVEDLPANDDGDTLGNTAHFRWSYTDDIAGPPADASFDPGDGEYSDTASIELTEPDVGISKVVDGAASADVAPGDTFTYEVTVSNTGSSTAYGVAVSDDVPAGVVVNEATITGGGLLSGEDGTTGAGGTITWLVSSLPVGSGNAVTLEYDASLAPSATIDSSVLTNTADVGQYFSHPDDDADSYSSTHLREYDGPADTADVTPQFPVPTVTKTATDTTAYIDESTEFTISVENVGDSTAYDHVLVDTLPAGWVYDSGSTEIDSSGAADPGVSGQELTWTLTVDLAPGETFELVYTATPDVGATWDASNTGSSYDHTNSVTVNADDGSGAGGNLDGDYTDSTDEDVQIHRTDIAIVKEHTGDPVAGETFVWTLDVSNDAAADTAVGPIVITDTLPSDATFESLSGTGWSGSEDSGVVTLTHAGPLAPGASLPTATITVSLDSDLAENTTFDNTATVTSGTFEIELTDNTDTDEADVTTLADVELVKTEDSTTYVAGTDSMWEIVVTNNGPSTSRAPLTVVDDLPAGLDVSTVTTDGTGWTCDPVNIVAETVTCTWGTDLADGASTTALEITGEVDPGFTGTLTNTATVTPTTSEPSPPGTTNNDDTTTSGSVDSEADVALTKSIVTPDANPGELLPAAGTGRYRLDIVNNGPSDALNIEVSDSLPAGLTFAGNVTTDAGDDWDCTGDSADPETVTCTLESNLGTIADEDTTWIEFDVDIASSVTGELVNEATVTTTTTDTNPDNNTDDVAEDAYVITNLSITKEHDDTPVYRVGDEVTFTVTVTNDGPADAVDVSVAEIVPDGLAYVGVDNDTGWTVVGPDVDGDYALELDAPLAAGSSPTTASIDVILEITQDGFPSVTNDVSVTTDTLESDYTDNSADEPVTVHSPDLEITKTVSESITEGGESLTYTLTVVNVDDNAFADDITVTDDIPFDLTVTTDPDDIGGADWDCTLTGTDGDGYGGTLECTLTTLAADTAATELVFDVTVLDTVARDTITNTADVASPDEHPDYVDERNEDDIPVQIRWIEVNSAGPSCLVEAPYLDYDITLHNVDSSTTPVTFTWYADDGSGNPTGDPIDVFTIEPGEPLNGTVLWPGAEVDEDGAGIAWPGLRPVIPGSAEVPTFENLIEDPSLPTFPLRSGAVVVIEANPETTITLDYPLPTADCFIDRDPTLSILKVADGDTFNRSQTVNYTITTANVDYGATNVVSMSDPVDSDLRVTAVAPADSPEPDVIPEWRDCAVSGQDTDGYGGTIDCTLDGWLGYGQTAPDIVVTAQFRPDAELGTVPNVATALWEDPDGSFLGVRSVDDPYPITLVLSAAEILALTGFGSGSPLWWALALILVGGALILVTRYRERRTEQ